MKSRLLLLYLSLAASIAAGAVVPEIPDITPTDKWGMVRIPVASLRTAGRHAAEMATQAVMGTPVRILTENREFLEVQTPEGYTGWAPTSSLVTVSADSLRRWQNADRYIVTAPWQQTIWRSASDHGPRDVVSDIVNGSIVVAADIDGDDSEYMCVVLPDGRKGYILRSALTPIAEWAAQPFDAQKILDTAYSMEGAPYLWGGMSTKAPDCSGLVKISYFSNGIILKRDASQQALTGTRIEASDWPSCRAGDLLFFGNPRTSKVTHVGIYDHDGNYVHASGRVKRNSVDPNADNYLTKPFFHAVRIDGNQGSDGITRAADHPWYFNISRP